MGKSSGHNENNCNEFPNFELLVFDEPPSKTKRIAYLSERELKGRETLGDKSLRHVAGTSRRNKSPCVTRLIS